MQPPMNADERRLNPGVAFRLNLIGVYLRLSAANDGFGFRRI
jgi:hypothetical protein